MTVQIQRPLRGSRISSFYPIKNLPSLASLDSAFQLQEYISLLIRLDVHDVDAIVSLPGKKDVEGERGKHKERDTGKHADQATGIDDEKHTEDKKAAGEIAVDEACWIYEQLRRLAQDLSHPLITTLQQECTRASCPEMKAGEWLYLCVAHGNDGAMEQCCAIDYILHTVDSATALLNSPRAFPSRLQIPQASHRHFPSLARRLGRIFAHAYFHHREAFEQAEVESSLYARFLALTERFDLVPPEFLVIPPVRVVDDPGRGDRDRDRHREGRGERDKEGVQPPRLLAAALDPSRSRDRGSDSDGIARREKEGVSEKEREDGEIKEGQWGHWSYVPSELAKSHSPPGLGKASDNISGSESPRKIGRTRTDTMVYSDATAFVERVTEDPAKTEPETEAREVVPPSPSENEDMEVGGTKEPTPTPATESEPESEPEPESESESESHPPPESPSEHQPESEPEPQPELKPEPEPVVLADDQPQHIDDSAATEDAVAVADSSEIKTPAEVVEPSEHTTDPVQAEDSSSSSAADSESDPEPEPITVDILEQEDEAKTGSEVEAETAAEGGGGESDGAHATKEETPEEPISAPEPEARDTESEGVKPGAEQNAESENEGGDFTPAEKVELSTNISEKEETEPVGAVEASAEEPRPEEEGAHL